MKKSNVVIYGTGLISELYHYYLSNNEKYKVVGFTNKKDFIEEETFLDLPVVNFEDVNKIFSSENHLMLISVGYLKRNKIRTECFDLSKKMGYRHVSYISPQATYYKTPVGENTFIFENNVIQPFVSIGDNNIIWSGNHIGHHSRIMDNCFISSHVVISGNCIIENNCFLGVNSTIADGITVGEYSVVGAGAVVTKSVPPNSLVVPERSKTINLRSDIL